MSGKLRLPDNFYIAAASKRPHFLVSILLGNFGSCGLRYVLRRLRVAMPSEFLPQLWLVVGFQLEYLTHLCKGEWNVFIPLLNFRVMLSPRARAKGSSQKVVSVRDWNKDFNRRLSGISLHSQIRTAASVASSLHDP